MTTSITHLPTELLAIIRSYTFYNFYTRLLLTCKELYTYDYEHTMTELSDIMYTNMPLYTEVQGFQKPLVYKSYYWLPVLTSKDHRLRGCSPITHTITITCPMAYFLFNGKVRKRSINSTYTCQIGYSYEKDLLRCRYAIHAEVSYRGLIYNCLDALRRFIDQGIRDKVVDHVVKDMLSSLSLDTIYECTDSTEKPSNKRAREEQDQDCTRNSKKIKL